MDWSSFIFKPFVMDKESLQKVVLEQGLGDQGERIAKMEGIQFSDVHELSLGYKDILKIDHLWEFTSLTKLELNSNLIKKIEGLDRLTNLTWLDLSFNKIEKIVGLETLKNLELLNLSNNKISVIENMDTLEKLTIFSIADNLLEKLHDVLSLRRFKNLFSLNISGNPLSKDEDCKYLIAANFPKLKYLNCRYLDEKTDAFVEFLNGPHLFQQMHKEDPHTDELHSLPEIASLHSTFKSQIVQLCMQLFEIGLEEHKHREKAVNSFVSSRANAVAEGQQKASQVLAKFEQQYNESIAEMQELSDPEPLTDKINVCIDEIQQLRESLLMLEFELISQMEDLIKKLDNSISDMVASFSETAQGIFVQCRDLENEYNEKVRNVAVATLEKVAKGNVEEDMPEDVRMLFMDKDNVMDVLATCHNNHVLAISDRETHLITRLNDWKDGLIKASQAKALQRNRMGISDINSYVDYLMEQLNELQ
ncbi:dynein regulatory complex subunit 3 isoform X3 [Sphaeramia orbicularis]|uniref:dynein regulatory complex subunit 3 isoform X3 n=1 Tax=Sphaeramia orbicularis TaxID=375764 RepID=UPI00117F6CDB|nr:dynein regulatory complex subunit 3 isoform X3 [Sphaeramia orbicularis]